jgi:regulator of cell morphogenesis and NO signaling
LQQACLEKGLNYVDLEKELRDLEFSRGPRASSYNQWPLDFLADYIVNTHHAYVEGALPELRGYAAKVAEVHGQEHPELLRVRELVEEINAELTEHMMKEERILFPYVRILAEAKKKNLMPGETQFGSIKNPIHVMEMEHESAGQILHEIRELTNGYKLPAEACTSYTLLFKLLEEFEDDLHVHIHLENNILFPKAAELEQSFRR